MEAHCEGGQGPPRAVMPRKKKKKFLYVVSIFIYGFLPPGNKALYSFLVKVLRGLSEPHVHLLVNLIIPKLLSMNGFLHWTKQTED
jgi:hypothetical protein